MEAWLDHFVEGLSFPLLLVIIAVTLYTIGKGADILVDEAVTLSRRWGMPQTLIGATIVSLGTTTPEASVSVFAAIKGSPDLALGNAVGSIICDTGLILGLAALIAPLPLNRTVVNRQGWLQLGAGALLIGVCIPYGSLDRMFSDTLLFRAEADFHADLDHAAPLPADLRRTFEDQGISLSPDAVISTQEEGRQWQVSDKDGPRRYLIRREGSEIRVYRPGGGTMPRGVGFLFLALLVVYMWQSIRWSRNSEAGGPIIREVDDHVDTAGVGVVIVKLILGIGVVVVSSQILIPAVSEAAVRMKVPQSIIAATLVAFGTSLPELVTAVTAARKGHGELAVGNVIGADILNVLFVAGAAAAVTGEGLAAPTHFFRILFPAMLFILIVFRIGVFASGESLKRPFGAVLIGAYILVTVLVYIQ